MQTLVASRGYLMLDSGIYKVALRHAPLRASAMIEALRGLGYNTATAPTNIIDNNIVAGADVVQLQFDWQEKASRIHVLYNCRGMSSTVLDTAMRLGERSPLELRDASDLGRFGLGLKTASFSQCRRLPASNSLLKFIEQDDRFE